MDFHQIVSFLIAHWQLSGIFIVLLIMLIIEESRAQGGKQKISPTELVSLMNQEQAYVVDLRDAALFSSGHIMGSKNISKSDVVSDADRLPKEETTNVVLVCQRGQTALSVFQQLKKKGLLNVKILKGGMDAWRQASMPVIEENKKQSKKDKKVKKGKKNG